MLSKMENQGITAAMGYENIQRMELFKELNNIAARPRFNHLSKEDLERKKELGLTSLLKVGYITPEEKEEYAKPITDLPTDRKALVVAYYLQAWIIPFPLTLEAFNRVLSLNDKYNLHDHYTQAKSKGKAEAELTLEDILGEDAAEDFKADYGNEITREAIRLAELFVDTKRKRIKKRLAKTALLLMCAELKETEPGKDELDPIADLRANLEKNGYKAKSKSLSQADIDLLKEGAEWETDLLEEAYLNGIIPTRIVEYTDLQDEEGAFKENFIYRDIYDEALLLLDPLPEFFVLTIWKCYTTETPTEYLKNLDELADLAKGVYKDTFKGTKFEPLTK